jgi:hypothetical protein
MSGSGSKEEPLTVAGCRFWQFPTFADQRGYLTVADFATMSFPVRRVFYISQVPEGQTRANHAQRESKELLLAITGTVSVLIDDGRNRQSIVLWCRNVGLLIAPKTWCSLSHFSKDAVWRSLPRTLTTWPIRLPTMMNFCRLPSEILKGSDP